MVCFCFLCLVLTLTVLYLMSNRSKWFMFLILTERLTKDKHHVLKYFCILSFCQSYISQMQSYTDYSNIHSFYLFFPPIVSIVCSICSDHKVPVLVYCSIYFWFDYWLLWGCCFFVLFIVFLFVFFACFETLLIHLLRMAECDVNPLQQGYSSALLPFPWCFSLCS